MVLQEERVEELNGKQLEVSVANARRIFKELERKHPTLDGYLVFSSRKGQAGIDSDPESIIELFSAMVVDSSEKKRCLEILGEIKRMSKAIDISSLKGELGSRAKALRYKGDVRIEIRFNRLDYKLIWELQRNSLVDRGKTPQSKASIRVVIGTLGELLSKKVGDYLSRSLIEHLRAFESLRRVPRVGFTFPASIF
jgi:hypothetical protein